MLFFKLFYTFFLIGLFSFGGGAAMMALIEQQVVFVNGWMSEIELYQFFGIAESTPGPIAVNIATAIGFNQAGIFGAACATLGVVLPSFIIICIIAALFNKLSNNKYFKVILSGITPIILGIVIIMIIKITCINIFGSFSSSGDFSFNVKALIITLVLLLISFIYKKIFQKKISPILLILISVVVGIVINM
jgi:chromate transporter